ncbi:MAG: TraR/DksA C4-type zinc finger protein [Pseudomonadota bacterium]
MSQKLTSLQIEIFKSLLQRRKRNLWQEVTETLRRDIGQEYQDRLRMALDDEDRSVVDLQEETVFSLMEPKKMELEEIEGALHRIQQGEYGVCVDCGEPIDMKRLEIMPQTPRCTRDQALLERARLRRRSL